MYLKRNRRLKDGKEHVYWNIVESKRCAGGKVVQRQVLYLGEINDGQRESWSRVIEAFDEGTQRPTQLAMFSADRAVPDHAQGYGIAVRLDAMELHRPRQWGACWLAATLYEQLGLDRFWADRAGARSVRSALSPVLLEAPALGWAAERARKAVDRGQGAQPCNRGFSPPCSRAERQGVGPRQRGNFGALINAAAAKNRPARQPALTATVEAARAPGRCGRETLLEHLISVID